MRDSTRAGVRRIVAEPLVHFLAIGAALFGLHAMVAPRDDAGRNDEIVVTRGRQGSLAQTFTRQWGRPPSRDELDGLMRAFVREEALAREALRLGLDRDDVIVRRRLAQKMEFLGDGQPPRAPTADALRAHLAAHPERFRIDARFTFTQVFLDPGPRGADLATDATALLAALNAGADPTTVGDARLLPSRWRDVAERDVAAQLGDGFAARLATLPTGTFAGPIESGYGMHLVRVERRVDGRVPPLDEIRDAVARDWVETGARDAADARLAALLARYRVTIEPEVDTAPERVAGAER